MAIQNNFPALKPTLLLDFANVERLDPRVTFARASTATYYGTQTAKAEENLILHSQAFNLTNFPISSATTFSENTADTTAPDGTSTADKATANAGTTLVPRAIQGVTVSTQVTFSVFAKQGTHKYLQLQTNAAGSGFVNFDLDAGTFSATTATGSITSVGSGWFRCVATMPASTPTNFQIGLAASASAVRAEPWNPVGTEALYLWGCQLEQRSAVTAYTPTTTQPITNYIPVLESAASGVARFDHNPNTFESLGLLIEESRTNLVLRSEEFDNASWSKVRSSIVANTVVAPDGTLTGDKLVANTDSNTHNLQQGATVVASSTNTVSVYMKAGEYTWGSITVNNGATFPTAYFNLATGAAGSVSAGSSSTMQSVGNGWYRCTLTFTMASGTTANVFLLIAEGDNDQVFAGNGFSGIFIWGAQLEAGAFPTSYIPTVASQVTRAADAASMTGANFSSWYNAGEGALYGEFSVNGFAPSGAFPTLAFISDGSATNFFGVGATNTGASLYAYGQVTSGGVAQAGFFVASNAFGVNSAQKAALTYKVNDFAFSRTGASLQTDNAGVIPVANRLSIGINTTLNGSFTNGHIRKLSFYPKRLTNAELQGLTS